MVSRPFILLIVAAVLAAFASPAVQAADLVIVASTAPGVSAGQIIQHDTPLDIPAGAAVTVIAENGHSKTIAGPHSGAAGIGEGGSGKGGVVASLSSLFTGPNQGVMALGVMRAAPPPPPQNPWVINTTRNGDHCVPSNGTVHLWRASTVRAQSLVVSVKGAVPVRASVAWSKGAETVEWPASIPLKEKQSYLLRSEDGRIARRVIMHLVPTDLATDAHKAAWMADKGCTQQALTLLGTIR